MKKIMIYLLVAIIGFTSVMTPFYSKAAMASDIALDAEVSELFYTIMINAMVAAGFMEADEMEYDDAMSCFESFCDAVVPVGTRTDSAGYAVDSSGNRLILLQNSAGAAVDLSNIITDGLSALKPSVETWKNFQVVGGSGGNNNFDNKKSILYGVFGATLFSGAAAWMNANKDNLPVKQQAPMQTSGYYNGTKPQSVKVTYTQYNGESSGCIGMRYYCDYSSTTNAFMFIKTADGTAYQPFIYNIEGNYLQSTRVGCSGYYLYSDGREQYRYNGIIYSSFPVNSATDKLETDAPIFASQEAALMWMRHIYYDESLTATNPYLNGCPLDLPGLIQLVPSMFDVLAGQKASVEDLLSLKPKLKTALDAIPALDTAANPALNNEKVKDAVKAAVEEAVSVTDVGTDIIVAPVVDADIKKYTFDLSTVFPFCIPFDLVALLKTLSADVKTPKFEVPIAFPAIDYEYTFVIDLSFLDSAAQVFRACITISFILALISITPKMIKW